MNFFPHDWLELLLQQRWQFDKTKTLGAPVLHTIEQAAPVRCAYCRAQITQANNAIEIAGAQQHVCRNPAGIQFIIVLYWDARCHVAGLPIVDHSWFNGYAWQLAHCPQCEMHLGWYYSQPQFPDFYGLIATRLIFAAQ